MLRFAVPPAKEGDAHRDTQGYDLYKIFCSQEERIVTNDFTVSYKGKIMHLPRCNLPSLDLKIMLLFVSISMEK